MGVVEFWNTVVIVSFFSFLACIVLAWWRLYMAGIAIACLVVFIASAAIRDNLVSNNLEELGCEYIGSGKNGQLHTSPTEYFKCPDGVIRYK